MLTIAPATRRIVQSAVSRHAAATSLAAAVGRRVGGGVRWGRRRACAPRSRPRRRTRCADHWRARDRAWVASGMPRPGKLAGALIRQIHLIDAGQQRADELRKLVLAAADPARPTPSCMASPGARLCARPRCHRRQAASSAETGAF